MKELNYKLKAVTIGMFNLYSVAYILGWFPEDSKLHNLTIFFIMMWLVSV